MQQNQKLRRNGTAPTSIHGKRHPAVLRFCCESLVPILLFKDTVVQRTSSQQIRLVLQCRHLLDDPRSLRGITHEMKPCPSNKTGMDRIYISRHLDSHGKRIQAWGLVGSLSKAECGTRRGDSSEHKEPFVRVFLIARSVLQLPRSFLSGYRDLSVCDLGCESMNWAFHAQPREGQWVRNARGPLARAPAAATTSCTIGEVRRGAWKSSWAQFPWHEGVIHRTPSLSQHQENTNLTSQSSVPHSRELSKGVQDRLSVFATLPHTRCYSRCCTTGP
jgi:hypothetical protein